MSAFKEFKDYLGITFGLTLYAIGFTCFILPYNIVTGGLTGIGSIIFYATGFWKVQYTFFLVNFALLCAAVKILGWKFCVKTIYAVIVLTFLLTAVELLMQHFYHVNPDIFYSWNNNVKLPQLCDNAFMSCLIGAGIEGIGIGIVFSNNGSSGGMDIVASIITKYRDITLGKILMTCDLIIVSTSMLLPNSTIDIFLYGLTTLIITSLCVDYVNGLARQSVLFFIISDHYDEIASRINELQRGVTVLNGKGWYTKEDRHVLLVLTRKRESGKIFNCIHSIDPNAFVSQTATKGVYGSGFEAMNKKAKNS